MTFDADNPKWKEPTRICGGCPERGAQPLENFYVSKTRPNGRTSQCKPCTRAYQQMRRAEPPRKQCVKAIPLWRIEAPTERVKLAFARGITDRVEMKRATRLPMDVLCDVIAMLNDEEAIQWDRKLGRFRAA